MKRHGSLDDDFALPAADHKLLVTLESYLEIDENAIDEELQEQAQHYYDVSKHQSLLVSKRDAAKQYLKELESRVYLSIKEKARVEDTKISEKELEHLCNIDPNIIKQQQLLLEINHALGQFTALERAFDQRKYMVRSMADLYIANYYNTNSVSGDVSKVKTRDAEHAKKQMATKRQEMNRRYQSG